MSTNHQADLSKVISVSGNNFSATQNMGISTVSGNQIQNSVNYSEKYPQGFSSVNLQYISTNYNNANPLVQSNMLNWYNALTGGNALQLPPLSTIIDVLVKEGYVVLTGPPPSDTAVVAFETLFNQNISGFLSYLQQNPSSLDTPQEYTDAFYAYLGALGVSGSDPLAQGFDAVFVSTDPSSPGQFTIPTAEINTLLTSQGLLNQMAIPVNLSNPAFVNQLISNFMAMLQHSSQDPTDPLGVDLINASSLTSSEQAELYNSSLGSFLKYVSTQTSSTDYFEQWQQGAVAFALMNYPTVPLPGSISTLPTAFTIYKELWNSYFPDQEEDFIPTLLAFISTFKNADKPFVPVGSSLNYETNIAAGQPVPVVGVTSGTLGQSSHVSFSSGTYDTNNQTLTVGFTPSGALSLWSNLLRVAAGGAPGIQTTDEAGFDQVQLIFRIYDLLLDMLNSLQVLTAAQLERQSFYAAYQSVYTESQANIAQVIGTNQVIGGYTTGISNITRRSDTSQLSAQYTESVKSFRSEINDFSSQQNTAVNQSQESTSQQVNLAQTLIQQFSTILQSIWR